MKQPTRQAGDQHYSKRTPERVLRGTDAPGAKLSPGEIAAMCVEFDRGASQTWLAKKYGVNRITVWRHVRARISNVTK